MWHKNCKKEYAWMVNLLQFTCSCWGDLNNYFFGEIPLELGWKWNTRTYIGMWNTHNLHSTKLQYIEQYFTLQICERDSEQKQRKD